MVTVNCFVCGCQCELSDVDDMTWAWIKKMAPCLSSKYTCRSCSDNIAAERMAEVEASREIEADLESESESSRLEKQWAEICPGEFTSYNPDKYPKSAVVQFESVMGWQYGKRGLMLYGPTGSGKTVAVWAMLKKHFFEGRSVMSYTANQFAIDAARIGMDSSDKVDKWLRRLKNVNILFVDDLGKRAMKEFGESQLFDVIDSRYANGKPMVFTCEGNADWLRSFLSESRRDGMIRRIRESCDAVKFSYE